MKRKLGVISLGCPRNLVDAESIVGRIDGGIYSVVDDIRQAEIALVNTCAFIEDAKRESIDAILDLIELKKEGRLKKIIVCGCLAQRYKDLYKELPEVDAFVGAPRLDRGTSRFALTPGHYAYLKICEGCLNNCSYCIIPAIKGRLTSLDEESVIRKVKYFNRKKISELNIIGQDITAFGMDVSGKSLLPGLLRKILDNSGSIGWIRLLYLNPERVNNELLGLIGSEDRICKYIDLPIQHINDRILKLMNRKVTKKMLVKLIGKIRKFIPGVSLRTSLIAGFPSETDKEFRELLDFVREMRFERLGVFIYSREEGTRAYSFKGQVNPKLKQERFDAIMKEQQSVSAFLNSGMMHKKIRVLIEEKQADIYIGRSQADAPEVDGLVYVRSARPLKPGDFAEVEITDTFEYDLAGETI